MTTYENKIYRLKNTIIDTIKKNVDNDINKVKTILTFFLNVVNSIEKDKIIRLIFLYKWGKVEDETINLLGKIFNYFINKKTNIVNISLLQNNTELFINKINYNNNDNLENIIDNVLKEIDNNDVNIFSVLIPLLYLSKLKIIENLSYDPILFDKYYNVLTEEALINKKNNVKIEQYGGFPYFNNKSNDPPTAVLQPQTDQSHEQLTSYNSPEKYGASSGSSDELSLNNTHILISENFLYL
jgi:hypothetical protein